MMMVVVVMLLQMIHSTEYAGILQGMAEKEFWDDVVTSLKVSFIVFIANAPTIIVEEHVFQPIQQPQHLNSNLIFSLIPFVIASRPL